MAHVEQHELDRYDVFDLRRRMIQETERFLVSRLPGRDVSWPREPRGEDTRRRPLVWAKWGRSGGSGCQSKPGIGARRDTGWVLAAPGGIVIIDRHRVAVQRS